MFFKASLLKQFIAILLSSVLLVSCTLDIGEDPLPATQAKTTGSECLAGIGEKMDRFFSAQATDGELNRFFSCVDLQLSLFVKSFAGQEDKNYYTPLELKKFLENAYFEEDQISEKLMMSLMEIKVWLVGGKLSNFSKSEFTEFLGWIRKLKKMVITLNPQMSILNVNNGWIKRNDQHIDEAISAYRIGMDEFLGELAQIPRPLRHSTMSTFVFELQNFSNWKNSGDGTKNIADFLASLKTLIVGEVRGHDQFDGPEWKEFARVSPGWISLWLRFHYQVKHVNFLKSADYRALSPWIKDLLDQLSGTLRSAELTGRPRNVIKLEVLQGFVETLGRFGVLPDNIRYQSIVELLKPTIQKIFGDFRKPVAERDEDNFTRVTVREMRAEYERWLTIQDFLWDNFSDDRKPIAQRFADFAVALYNKTGESGGLETVTRERVFELAGNPLNKLQEIVRDQVPLTIPGDPRTIIASIDYEKKPKHSYYQLSLMNMFRVAVRLAIRGYNKNHSDAVDMLGVKEDELSLFINEFKSIFEDLNLLPRDQENPGLLIALQANLFTYASNGIPESGDIQKPGSKRIDNLVDFNEGLYLFSYMLSSWKINGEVYPYLRDQCASENQLAKDSAGNIMKDDFGKPLILKDCFVNYIMRAISRSIDNLPHLKEELDTATWAPRKNSPSVVGYRNLMMGIAGEERAMGYIHVGKIVMVSHFIETLITNYDGSTGMAPNQVIDDDEAIKGLKIFRELIRGKVVDTCMEGAMKKKNACSMTDEQKDAKRKACVRSATDKRVGWVYKSILKKSKIPTGILDICWNCGNAEMTRFKSYRVFSTIINDIGKEAGAPTCSSK